MRPQRVSHCRNCCYARDKSCYGGQVQPGLVWGGRTMRWRLLRPARATGAPSWQCPVCVNCKNCKQRFADDMDLKYGVCVCCNALTGRCAAGRWFMNPDLITLGALWRAPCSQMGVVPRTFAVGGEPVTRLLCVPHNQEVDDGKVPWLTGPPLPALASVARPVPFTTPPLPALASVAGPGRFVPLPPGAAASN